MFWLIYKHFLISEDQ